MDINASSKVKRPVPVPKPAADAPPAWPGAPAAGGGMKRSTSSANDLAAAAALPPPTPTEAQTAAAVDLASLDLSLIHN